MRYELETPAGQRVPYTADHVSFEGGGVQLWRLVERPQAPPGRVLLGAWAPGAWLRLWPGERAPDGPGPSPHGPAGG